MRLVLDSSIICADFQMVGPHFQTLLNSMSDVGVHVIVPEVVVDEIVANHELQLNSLTKEWSKLLASAGRCFGRKQISDTPPWGKNPKPYREYFDDLAKRRNFEIAPYPRVDHKKLVKNILGGRPPFHNKDKGYRDSLIWQTVVELAGDSTVPIVLATSNTSDFGRDGIFPELLKDISSRGVATSVTISESLKQFNDQHINPMLVRLSELVESLNADTERRISIRKWAESQLITHLRDNDYEGYLSHFHPDHVSVHLSKLELTDFEVSKAFCLPSSDIVITVWVGGKAHLGISASHHNCHYSDVREYFGYIGETESVYANEVDSFSATLSMLVTGDELAIKDIMIDELGSWSLNESEDRLNSL